MGEHSAARSNARPGRDLRRLLPQGPPHDWERAWFDGVVSWAFLARVPEMPHMRHLPWLILSESESPFGPVPFAVPRLCPESDLQDQEAYVTWQQAVLDGEATPVQATVTVEEAAARLPPSRTRPRFADRAALVRTAICADLEGLALAELAVVRDAPGSEERRLRAERERARRMLHLMGALPWAAYSEGKLPTRADWWRADEFVDAVRAWDRDAYRLWWRSERETRRLDPVDQAADMLTRLVVLEWSGLEPTWRPDDVAVAAARGLLMESARAHDGTCEQWLARFFGFEYQSPEARQEARESGERMGVARLLRDIWSAAREDTDGAHA